MKAFVNQAEFDRLVQTYVSIGKAIKELGKTVEEANEELKTFVTVYSELVLVTDKNWSYVPNRADRRNHQK